MDEKHPGGKLLASWQPGTKEHNRRGQGQDTLYKGTAEFPSFPRASYFLIAQSSVFSAVSAPVVQFQAGD